MSSKPRFFATPSDVGAWLAKNGAKRNELVVGFWKVGSGRPSMTWPEAIVEAIAHGWIDGIRHSLDARGCTVRFTPRKSSSNWSLVNVQTAKRLIAEGRMSAAGLAAFKARKAHKTGVHSAEQPREPKLSVEEEAVLRSDAAAWAGFSRRPPYYRSAALWWVISAKKPETRSRRFEHLVASSRLGKTVAPLTPRPGKK